MTSPKCGRWIDPKNGATSAGLEKALANPAAQLLVLAHVAAVAAFFANGLVSESTRSIWNTTAWGTLLVSVVVGWRYGRILLLLCLAVVTNLLARFLFMFDETGEKGYYFMGAAVFFVYLAAMGGAILGGIFSRASAPTDLAASASSSVLKGLREAEEVAKTSPASSEQKKAGIFLGLLALALTILFVLAVWNP